MNIIGDVGAADLFHLGDAAMLEAALLELGARLDVSWTVLSRDPDETAARYGIEAVNGFGFADIQGGAQREARLADLEDAARGRAPGSALPRAQSSSDSARPVRY